ncbi:MAG: hypothetical protein NXI27_27780 [Alphaproteobacteria bacterium]|nr:hypothetical protein [Alphaproteobacteria bacterium]
MTTSWIEPKECINFDTAFWDDDGRREKLFRLVVDICENLSQQSYGRYYDRCLEIYEVADQEGNLKSAPAKFAFVRYMKRVSAFLNTPDNEPAERGAPRFLFKSHTASRTDVNSRIFDRRFYNAMAAYAVVLYRQDLIQSEEQYNFLSYFLEKGAVGLRTEYSGVADLAIQILTNANRDPESDPLSAASKGFFGSSESGNPGHQFFETYRFSSKPGEIDKSFTVIKPPLELLPITRFVNFFQAEESALSSTEEIEPESHNRRVDGLVLTFARGTYLIGPSENSGFLKIMVLKPISTGVATLHGAALTSDFRGNLVMGKVLLKRTDIARVKYLQSEGRKPLGSYEISELDNELSPSELRELRNECDMKLEHEICEWNGNEYEEINQLTMVGRVETLLSGMGGDEGGRFVLKQTNNGKYTNFNPASVEYYTFNGAIKI